MTDPSCRKCSAPAWSYAHRQHKRKLADRITRGTIRLLQYDAIGSTMSASVARAWGRQIRADVDELCATIQHPTKETA